MRSACEIVIGNPERKRPFETKTLQALFPVIIMNLKGLWCDTVNYVWLRVDSTSCGTVIWKDAYGIYFNVLSNRL
jgi:hypothetical protein